MLKRKMLVLFVFCFISVSLQGCSKNEDNQISVGTKDFTESYILGELYALALEKEGYQVERKFNLGGTNVIHTSMIEGEVDVYPEYTGTCLINVLKEEPMSNSDEVYELVKREYAEKYELAVLKPSMANNSQGLAISREKSQELGIINISDLQQKAENIRFASQGAFEENSDGMPALIDVYGEFAFKSVDFYDNAIKYELIKNNETDLIVAFTTDGQLTDDAYVLLEDDRHAWTTYNIVPIVRQELLNEDPKVEEILNNLSAILNTEIMQELNAEVDIKKREPEDVAREFFNRISDEQGKNNG